MKKRILTYAIAASLLLSGVALGATSIRTNHEAIDTGDWVSFHMTARNETGEIVFTTNRTLADQERLDGNMYLPNRSVHYGLLNTTVRSPVDVNKSRVAPHLYLLGAQAGETVETPRLTNPFGESKRYELDKVIEPIAKLFTYNHSEIENSSSLTPAETPDELEVGALVRYAGGMDAEVVATEDKNITFRLHLPDNPVELYSDVFGFNMTIQQIDEHNASIRPQLGIGSTFRTQGCQLPGNILPPGEFTVVDQSENAFLLEPDMGMAEPLFGQVVTFEFEVISVEEPSVIERIGRACT